LGFGSSPLDFVIIISVDGLSECHSWMHSEVDVSSPISELNARRGDIRNRRMERKGEQRGSMRLGPEKG
jgi:hypothetical protein